MTSGRNVSNPTEVGVNLSPRRLFIAGATGAVGRVLVPMARAAGVSLVAHARPKSANKLDGALAFELDDSKLVEAMRGCTTVVQLIGTMRKRFSSGDTYETSDIGTTRRLVEVARTTGVDHLILLSSVGAGTPRGAYLAAKARAEALVRESGVPFTILRPSAFEDREGLSMPGVRTLTRWLGLTRYQPIKVAELASALLRVALQRGPLGVELEGQPLWDVVEAAAAGARA